MNSAIGYTEGAEVPEDKTPSYSSRCAHKPLTIVMTQEQLDNKTDVIEMTESDIIEHCIKHTSSGLALNPDTSY